jgi:anti-anti-sigma factor
LSSSKDVHDGMPRVATVSLRGELSDADADRVLELGRQALAPADVSTLVIDMAEVTFIDTMVIGALVQLRHMAQPADVEVRLRGLRPGIRRVLTIAGVDTLFTYQDSPEGS